MSSYLVGIGATWSWPGYSSGPGNWLVLLLVYLIPIQDLLDAAMRIFLRYVNTASASADSSKATSVPLEIPDATPYQVQLNLRPYAILLSVRNVEGKLGRFLQALGAHRDRLWVFDDQSTDGTVAYLRRENLHVVVGTENCKKPCAIRSLLREIPPDVVNVVVVDPDCEIPGSRSPSVSELERALYTFQQSGMAALCPRFVVNEKGTILESLQALEYDLACSLGKRSMGDHVTTSGVAVYRRDALERALDEHSLSVYAEDLENTFLLLGAGERTYYDERLTVKADCPDTFRWWFSQRVGWAYGLLRVCVSRWSELSVRGREGAPRRGFSFFYQYYVYVGLYSIVLQPVRLIAVLLLSVSAANGVEALLGLDFIPDGAWTSPARFAFVYAQCSMLVAVVVLVVLPAKRALAHLPVVPLYVLYGMAGAIPMSLGFANWCTLRLLGVRLYRDHYDDAAPTLAAGSP